MPRHTQPRSAVHCNHRACRNATEANPEPHVLGMWATPVINNNYYKMGVAYEAIGKTKEAERDYQKAKDLGYIRWAILPPEAQSCEVAKVKSADAKFS